MCKRKIAVRNQLREKLGKSLSASSCDVSRQLHRLFFHCSRSSISTNVGSWLSSKRICWRSPRCRLRRRRSKDRVDALWHFVGLRTDRLFCIGCVDIAIRIIHSNQTHDAQCPHRRGGKSFGVLNPCMPSRASLDRGDCSQSFWVFHSSAPTARNLTTYAPMTSPACCAVRDIFGTPLRPCRPSASRFNRNRTSH